MCGCLTGKSDLRCRKARNLDAKPSGDDDFLSFLCFGSLVTVCHFVYLAVDKDCVVILDSMMIILLQPFLEGTIVVVVREVLDVGSLW